MREGRRFVLPLGVEGVPQRSGVVPDVQPVKLVLGVDPERVVDGEVLRAIPILHVNPQPGGL